MNQQDKDLFLAVENGSVTGMQAALAAGAKLEARDDMGRTVVWEAINRMLDQGDTISLTELLRLKANFRAVDDTGQTPLHYLVAEYADMFVGIPALFDNTLDIFKQAHADFNALDANGMTPVLLGAEKDSDYHFIVTMHCHGSSLDVADYHNIHLSHWVASWNDPVTFRYLQQQGVSTNVRDRQKNTPLHYMARLDLDADAETIVSILRDAGMDLHAKNRSGKTAADLWMDCHPQATVNEMAAMIAHVEALPPPATKIVVGTVNPQGRQGQVSQGVTP